MMLLVRKAWRIFRIWPNLRIKKWLKGPKRRKNRRKRIKLLRRKPWKRLRKKKTR